MKKTYILILLTLFSLMFIKINKVNAITGVINEPYNTGLWHEISYDHDVTKAYVHFKFYSGETIFKTYGPNESVGYDTNHATNLSNESMFDLNILSSDRLISAPDGFKKLYLWYHPFSGTLKDETYELGDVKDIRIVLNDKNNSDRMIIYNSITNDVIYKLTSPFWGSFKLYWLADNEIVNPPNEDPYIIINDPGTTGLWHEIDTTNDEYRAYIYMRWYYNGDTSLTAQTLKDDHSNSNPNMIPHSNILSFQSHFDDIQIKSDDIITKRSIRAPRNYDMFHISHVDNGNLIPVYTGNVTDITVSLICKGDELGQVWDMIIHDDKKNEDIYHHERFGYNFVMYWTGTNIQPPNYDSDDVIDCGNDYAALPMLNKRFILIDKFKLLQLSSNTYKLYINNNMTLYSFDITLPNSINPSDYIKSDGKLNISYSTFKEKKFLYLQPDLSKNPYPIISGTIDNPSELLVGFITINLHEKDDNGNLKYEEVKKLTFDSLVEKSIGDLAYMYMFFDIPIEKILNIYVKFDYRYRYFGIKGDWNTAYNMYAWDDTHEVNFPWWVYLNVFTASFYKVIDWTNILNIKETIKVQTRSDLSDKVITRFENELNGDVTKLNDLKIFKVYLGQFTTFGSTNFDIRDDYGIIEMTYQYDGIVYQVPFDKLDQNNKGTVGNDDDESLWNFGDFLKFTGVKGLADFFMHIVKFWKETIVTFGFSYIVIKMFLSLKRKRY